MAFPGVQLAGTYKYYPEGKQMVIEPKLDGYRLAICWNGDDTITVHCRDAKPPSWEENIQHIVDAVTTVPEFHGHMIDGEVMAADWGATSKLLRTQQANMSADMLDRLESEVKFNIFDVVGLTDVYAAEKMGPRGRKKYRYYGVPMHRRRRFLEESLADCRGTSLIVTPQFAVNSADETDELFAELLDLDFEGAMLKDPDAPYWFTRSPAWLKLKPFKTVEMTVTGMVEGEGKHAGRLGALTCADPDGRTVRVGTGFSDSMREACWDLGAEIDGYQVEVRMQDDRVAIARHPAFLRFRDDRNKTSVGE